MGGVFCRVLGTRVAFQVWFVCVDVFFVLVFLGFGHDLATLCAFVIHAGAGYTVKPELAHFNRLLTHVALFGLKLLLL